MPGKGWRGGVVGLGALAWSWLAAAGAWAQPTATAQGPLRVPSSGPWPSPQAPDGGSAQPMLTIQQLVRMSPRELDQLYQQSGMGPIPAGKARGRAIVFPGTRYAAPASRLAKLYWQGKIFHPDGCTAVNKFCGIRMIKANVYPGTSWMDGNPALILDYSQTSWLYAPYRDEIRQVAPGLFLGLMYERTCPQPTFKLYFVLETACPQ